MPGSTTPKRPTLLGLPPEIRNKIYDFAIQPSRLALPAFQDWTNGRVEGFIYQNMPGLLFTCHQIYDEACSFFYSRSTLTVVLDCSLPDDNRTRDHFLQKYSDDYAFCRRGMLRLVQSVHVFRRAKGSLDETAFQAFFIWLVTNTGIKSIFLSKNVMQWWQKRTTFIDFIGTTHMRQQDRTEARAIDVFAMSRWRQPRPEIETDLLIPHPKQWPGTQLIHLLLQKHTYRFKQCTDSRVLQFHHDTWYGVTSDAVHVAKKEMIVENYARVADRLLNDPFLGYMHAKLRLSLCQSIWILPRSMTGSGIEELPMSATLQS